MQREVAICVIARAETFWSGGDSTPKFWQRHSKARALEGKKVFQGAIRKLTGEWAQQDNFNSQAPGTSYSAVTQPPDSAPGPRG